MPTPPVWSDNVVRNFERIIEWTEAIAIMSDVTSVQYELYKNKMTCKIEEENVQHAIISLCANYGCLFEWITLGIESINTNPRLPDNCRITSINLKPYESSWKKHINTERTILDDLKKDITLLKDDVIAKLKEFLEEESDGYSSYSDYSEETSSSKESECEANEEEEDEEEEDNDEEIDKEEIDISEDVFNNNEREGNKEQKNEKENEKERQERNSRKKRKPKKRRN